MVATCLHLAGFVCSFIGWIGVVVATATNDWVVTCGYTITTCRKMDELGSKGLWADCVMATGLYHCKPLVDILILPGYVQACRALMIAASVLGLPAIFLLITVLPCIRMGHEPGAAKYRRSQLGGILIILLVGTGYSCMLGGAVLWTLLPCKRSLLRCLGEKQIVYLLTRSVEICNAATVLLLFCSDSLIATRMESCTACPRAMCGVVATIWFPVCAHRETTIMSFGYSLYTGWIGSALCLFGGCVIVCCSGDAQTFGENRFYYASGSSSPTHAKSAHV